MKAQSSKLKPLKFKKQIEELLKGKTYLTCPKCGADEGLEFGSSGWSCLWKECPFSSSSYGEIPSPHYIEELLSLKEKLEYLEFLATAGLLK